MKTTAVLYFCTLQQSQRRLVFYYESIVFAGGGAVPALFSLMMETVSNGCFCLEIFRLTG